MWKKEKVAPFKHLCAVITCKWGAARELSDLASLHYSLSSITHALLEQRKPFKSSRPVSAVIHAMSDISYSSFARVQCFSDDATKSLDSRFLEDAVIPDKHAIMLPVTDVFFSLIPREGQHELPCRRSISLH